MGGSSADAVKDQKKIKPEDKEAKEIEDLRVPNSRLTLEVQAEADKMKNHKILMERFERLKNAISDNLTNPTLSNYAMPQTQAPKIVDSYKADMTNIFAKPSIENFLSLGWMPESNSMATSEQISKIMAEWEKLGVPKKSLAQATWAYCRYCVGASSSPHMDPNAADEQVFGHVTRDAMGAVIKKHVTLRQFNRFFAPIMWNYMITMNLPPSDWQRKNFTEDTKFAAFDCFDFVMNPAAHQPLEGLIRKPTKEEVIANQTFKSIALNRRAQNDRFANLGVEITGGKFGCDKKMTFRESSCG
uniref:Capsid protein n=1 Tax=Carrot carlavirus WM-2008 TaxID=552517 RepID=B5AZR7_9VIRU|nr:coat protein [Carrot carlavirus WM-2008]